MPDNTDTYGLHTRGPLAFYIKESGELVYFADENARNLDKAMTVVQSNITEVVNNISNIVAGANPAFVFQQATPTTTWVITHNLNGYPTVVIIDSAGQSFIGDVQYDTPNQLAVLGGR